MRNFILISFLFTGFSLMAQSGLVRGKTFSASNNVAVSDVKIQIVELSKGVKSDSLGVYEITSIPPGIYTFKAVATGFKPAFQNEITVTNARSVTLDFYLEEIISGKDASEVVVKGPKFVRAYRVSCILKNVECHRN